VRYHYVAEPHPHLVIEEIVPPPDFESLRFPDDLMTPAEAWGITATDPQYATVLADPRWRALYDELAGEAFIRTVLRCFAGDMRAAGCLIDPEQARLSDFTESRREKELASLPQPGDPNEIFTRIDFQSKAQVGYREFVHLDWPRRITGGILFFSDAEEEGLEGGELAFYRDRRFRNDRWCHEPELVARFPPTKNSGVIFLNSNAGFHGPRAITQLRGRRRWLYYAISSRADVWPHAPRQNVVAANG
jgi:hypothetical protein